MIYHAQRFLNYFMPNEIEVDPNFDYLLLSDEDAEYGKESFLREIGFFIPPSMIQASDEELKTYLGPEYNFFITEPYTQPYYRAIDAYEP